MANSLLNNTKKKKDLLRSNRLFVTLCLVWPTINFLLFWVYIYVDTIGLSFQTLSEDGYKWIWFKNYENFFRMMGEADSALYHGIINSLMMFVANIFVLIPISIFVSFCFFKKILGYKAFRIIYYLPNIVSIAIMTMLFRWAFDADVGFMNKILGWVGISQPELGFFGENNSFNMVIIYSWWVGVGYYAMLLSGSMARIPTEILESARLDGASFFVEFFKIVLPLCASTVSTLVIMSMGGIFTYFLPAMLLTGGQPNGHSTTIALEMTNAATVNPPSSATIGVISSCIAVPLVLSVKRLLEKFLPEVEF
ncbi:MAG: sugar ABC transporter permease [Clostridia bacterium]|nr:sugar ABC transporter permease [Clostridia bacterium]